MTFNHAARNRLLVVGLVIAAPVLLHAHIELAMSAPAAKAVLAAPPSELKLDFNETPDLKDTKVDIKGPSDKVKLGKLRLVDGAVVATIEGDMSDGDYTVSWQVTDEGEVEKGAYTFTVKKK